MSGDELRSGNRLRDGYRLRNSFATGCGDYCTAWVVKVASKAGVTAQLQARAAANCSMCSFETPPCVASASRPCVDGKCMQYHPL